MFGTFSEFTRAEGFNGWCALCRPPEAIGATFKGHPSILTCLPRDAPSHNWSIIFFLPTRQGDSSRRFATF